MLEPEKEAGPIHVMKPGNDPKCDHKDHCPQIDDGHGSVCYFSTCLKCGAKLSIPTGDDPFLRQLESSREPPDDR